MSTFDVLLGATRVGTLEQFEDEPAGRNRPSPEVRRTTNQPRDNFLAQAGW